MGRFEPGAVFSSQTAPLGKLGLQKYPWSIDHGGLNWWHGDAMTVLHVAGLKDNTLAFASVWF